MSSTILNYKKKNNTENLLHITDLDIFFKNIYDYYYNRGYSNILVQTILDNLSYLFSLHFFILNFYLIDWNTIIHKCINENQCDSDLIDFINLKSMRNIYFTTSYSLLVLYYLLYLYKSVLNLHSMKFIKSIYDYKLHVKQKEMENIRFEDIMNRLIDLQNKENFCRVKENLTKTDIVSRILRKDNFLIGIVSSNVLNFNINIPFLGQRNFFSNHLYCKLNESIMNYAFSKGEVNINSNFFNLRYLQLKLLTFMLIELLFIFPFFFYKLIFWVFKNADNIKTNRNITQKIWPFFTQILFRNYNELQHYFEYRINESYESNEKFMNCFKERLVNIFGKFIILVCGSIMLIILILSTIDNRLFTNLKILGKNLIWITFVIGIILSIFGDKNRRYQEEYLENITLKEKLYKQILQSIINLPAHWKSFNLTKLLKSIANDYVYSISSMIKELFSIILFPYLWIRMITQAKDIIKYFKFCSIKIEGLGAVCVFSHFNIKSFRAFKEKDINYNEVNFNDRKYLNSYISFSRRFKDYDDNNTTDDDQIYLEKDNIGEELEERLFQIYIKTLKIENINQSINVSLNIDLCRDNFFKDIYYYLSKLNLNEILLNERFVIRNENNV